MKIIALIIAGLLMLNMAPVECEKGGFDIFRLLGSLKIPKNIDIVLTGDLEIKPEGSEDAIKLPINFKHSLGV